MLTRPPSSAGRSRSLLRRPRSLLTGMSAGLLALGAFLTIVALPAEQLPAFLVLLELKFSSAGNMIILAPILDPTLPFSPWFLAMKVTLIDVCVGLLVSAQFGWMLRLQWLGPRLRTLEAAQRERLSRRPWLRRSAWVGLFAIVLLPLPASGAVGGALFGRLLGLGTWPTVGGIAAGTAGAAILMASGARILGPFLIPLQQEAWFRAAGSLLLATLLGLLVGKGLKSMLSRSGSPATGKEQVSGTAVAGRCPQEPPPQGGGPCGPP